MTDPGPLPEPERMASAQMHLWLTADLDEWVRTMAFHQRVSRTEIVRRLIRREAQTRPVGPLPLINA